MWWPGRSQPHLSSFVLIWWIFVFRRKNVNSPILQGRLKLKACASSLLLGNYAVGPLNSICLHILWLERLRKQNCQSQEIFERPRHRCPHHQRHPTVIRWFANPIIMVIISTDGHATLLLAWLGHVSFCIHKRVPTTIISLWCGRDQNPCGYRPCRHTRTNRRPTRTSTRPTRTNTYEA